jgi:hypothetical protein
MGGTMKAKRRQPPKVEEPQALYRVFRVEDGELAYLPAPGSKGLPQEEAVRLSEQLAIETEIREVWRSEEVGA